MLGLRRCLSLSSKTRRLPAFTPASAEAGAGAVAPAGVTTRSRRHFAATLPTRSEGNLADVCNLHAVSSRFPTISDTSDFSPVAQFVSSQWKGADLAGKVAIRDGSTSETRTFSEYHDHMNNIAAALAHEYALKPGETVALFSPNNVNYLPISLAAGICGAKVTPINPLSTVGELGNVLGPSGARILFAHAKLLPVALEAARASPGVEHVVVIPDVEPDADLPQGADGLGHLLAYETARVDQHPIGDLAECTWLLPYSSGTTGMPKGVMLSHANMISNLLQLEEIEGAVFPPEHKLITPLPFFHIYGMLASLLHCAWRGHEVITTSDRFDLEKFCRLVQEHRPERAHLVPPIILGLAKHPVVDNYDISSLKMVLSAAAPLGKDTQDAVKKRLSLNIKQAWGMSELSPLGTCTEDDIERVGSVGRVVSSTQGKIIDPDTGKSLGPNEPGELCIKGPQVMMGYLNDIEKTKGCLSDDGWLRTGDLAYYDEEEYFYITDRIKELIKVRGFQVAPAELEELLLHNEHVQDAAVIQVPDEVSGELPRAYVVLKPSVDGDAITEEGLRGWVKERVAPYKRIDGGVVFVDQIPKSASGKILRRILRDEAKRGIESG